MARNARLRLINDIAYAAKICRHERGVVTLPEYGKQCTNPRFSSDRSNQLVRQAGAVWREDAEPLLYRSRQRNSCAPNGRRRKPRPQLTCSGRPSGFGSSSGTSSHSSR